MPYHTWGTPFSSEMATYDSSQAYNRTMSTLTYHGKCGKSWIQHGNRSGHCSSCHETFGGLTAFTKHQLQDDSGNVICREPESLGFEWDEKDMQWHQPFDGVKWWEKDTVED